MGVVIGLLSCVAGGGGLPAAQPVLVTEARWVHIAPAPEAAGPADAVICVQPRPIDRDHAAVSTAPVAWADLEELRAGLFDLCEGYRTGAISAETHRSALEDVPALILLLAARSALGERLPLAATTKAIAEVETHLGRNRALRTLCLLPAFAGAGGSRMCGMRAAP